MCLGVSAFVLRSKHTVFSVFFQVKADRRAESVCLNVLLLATATGSVCRVVRTHTGRLPADGVCFVSHTHTHAAPQLLSTCRLPSVRGVGCSSEATHFQPADICQRQYVRLTAPPQHCTLKHTQNVCVRTLQRWELALSARPFFQPANRVCEDRVWKCGSVPPV